MMTISLNPLSGYSFGVKDPIPEDDPNLSQRMARLMSEYSKKGMRKTVEAVLLVHEHEHPHILMFQALLILFKVANSFYKLPGGELEPGEDEVGGLKRHLKILLSTDNVDDLEVGEILGVW